MSEYRQVKDEWVQATTKGTETIQSGAGGVNDSVAKMVIAP